MSDQIDFEHAVLLLEEHLGGPVPEPIIADLQALVAHTLRIGSDQAINAAKRLVAVAYDTGATKADLLTQLDRLTSDKHHPPAASCPDRRRPGHIPRDMSTTTSIDRPRRRHRRALPLAATVAAITALALYLAIALAAIAGTFILGGLDAIAAPTHVSDLRTHPTMTSWIRGALLPAALLGLAAGAGAGVRAHRAGRK
ncbi:hypothetical protein [Mycobacterium hubeiense]|uniref:hypothetical protein n=1 Tax=Mycobacterium hubeiense TaxID=1867256 RepID=UPI000C7F053F|nr:hypothetical protein [Mycobacterium sp. QGD 101]